MCETRISSLLGKITVFFVICCCCLPSQAKYGGGWGWPKYPYLIYTAEQMNAIGADSSDWNKHFKLCADIDLACFSGTEFNIIGYYKSWNSPDNKPFTGVFDGNGYRILNFSYTSTDAHNIGLFGYVTGEIKNLGLIVPDVNAGTGSYVGSLVGRFKNGTINKCYVEGGSITGNGIIGGLVGYNIEGTISNCYSGNSVSGISTVGGLLGAIYYNGTITNCYSTASVSGETGVGGLMGEFRGRGTISDCYSIGSVDGYERVGGLVGLGRPDFVSNSFWDIETSGQPSSAGGTGKTTAEMQMASTFAVWACASIWTIDEGKDYPRLAWQNMPGETISPSLYLYGNGTQAEPYLIYTADQFNMIGLLPCIWDKHFKLMADIDLGAYKGTDFNIIGNYENPFCGVFNGNGHTISNFTWNSSDRNFIGLFGFFDGDITNVRLINAEVNAGTGDLIGGLVGWNRYGTITNCCVYGGSITGNGIIGGLVGYNIEGTISNCYSCNSVSGFGAVGGLVGANYMDGTITNCYSTASVSGDDYVGGLVGYSSGGPVSASFWDIETSGQTTSAGGTGLPTDQMQTMSTFTDAGWDFVGETFNGIEDIWFIPQQDYPHLWWEGMQVPMKLTPRTLNCRSYGNWVKAHLTLPQGFTVADVNSNRPAVLHSFGFQSAPLYVFVNKDKLVEIEAAFERQKVCSLVDNWPQELTVAGFLTDGNIFLGTSTVRVIHPGMKVIEELASCWLQGNCVHPTWCDGIDMNRDSLVNLLDYALLMNIEVEFVTDE